MPNVYTLSDHEMLETAKLEFSDDMSQNTLHWKHRDVCDLSIQHTSLREGLLFTHMEGSLHAPIKLLNDPTEPWIGLGIQLSGAIDSTMDRRAVNLDASTFNLIREKPCTSGSVFHGSQGDYRSIHFRLSTEYFDAMMEDNEAFFPALAPLLKNDDPFRLSSAPVPTDRAMAQLALALHACPLKGSMKSMFVEGKFLELLTMLHLPAIRKQDRDRDLFFAIREYLDVHYHRSLSLQGLAKEFGINDFKLKKGFRDIFNTTVFDYVIEKRMTHARRLIHSTTASVSEISSTIGYKTPTHFTTAFRKRFGVSPSQLRK